MRKKIVIFLLLHAICLSIIEIDTVDGLTATALQQDSLVKVSQNSDILGNLDEFESRYYILTIMNKNKRRAYDLFKIRYKRTIEALSQLGIIGSQKTLTKSKPKSNFVNKAKMWQFSIIFCIQQRDFKLQQAQIKLEEIGIRILKNSFQIDYLQDKFVASRIYNFAKIRLEKMLIQLGDQFEIKYVDDLEIDGIVGYDDSDAIEEELQTEDIHVQSYIERVDNNCDWKNNRFGSQLKVKMDVIFRIGRKLDHYPRQVGHQNPNDMARERMPGNETNDYCSTMKT